MAFPCMWHTLKQSWLFTNHIACNPIAMWVEICKSAHAGSLIMIFELVASMLSPRLHI